MSDRFISLSPGALKLLIDLLWQYKGGPEAKHGGNNGTLSACWTLMKRRGWKSSASVYRAKKELLDKGFIVVTKEGKKLRGCPTLFAITWSGISDCGVVYDPHIQPSTTPLSLWQKDPKDWHKPSRLKAVDEKKVIDLPLSSGSGEIHIQSKMD